MKIQSGKVLIVEDSKSTASAIESVLNGNYVVKVASTGEDALRINNTFHPDIILLDVALPGIDGYDVCREIRSGSAAHFTKIIMVSVRNMLEQRLKGYEAGADDYLVKPFEAEELVAKVRVFIRLRHAEKELDQLNRMLNQQISIRTRQLLEAEKMAVIGRYTAGIIHNLNNPLQAIMGNAELLSFKNPNDAKIMALRRASGQMKMIISSLLSAGYKNNSSEYTDVDLNQVIRDQIELLSTNPFYRHKILTKTDFQPLPLIRGIYYHFSQSLGNLIKNAVDAMYASETRELHIASSFQDKNIFIRISDTGPGIAPEYMEKIFHPFFTTKPLSAEDKRPTGTGLGLASAREMIEGYQGEIRVNSERGKGSEFVVRIPVKQREPE